MASKLELEALFTSEAYADSFKRGEMVTYPFAKMLVEQSKVASESKAQPYQPLVVLDNACGTGVVSSILNQSLDPVIKKGWKLTCGDISSAVLQHTQRRMEAEGWQNTETRIVDAQSSDLPSSFYTHIFTSFGRLLPCMIGPNLIVTDSILLQLIWRFLNRSRVLTVRNSHS
jgi:SAM-dependent methyltransferase